VQTRPIVLLTSFAFSLLCIACNKSQPSPTSAPASHVLPAPVASAAAASPVEPAMHFTAEVVRNEEFQKIFAPKMMFRLEPYGGNDSGWSMRIAPVSDTGGPAIDCIGAVETPLHGDTKVEIEPPQDGATQDPTWKHREFEYVATTSDCKTAWELMNSANYNSKISDKEREEAGIKLGQIPTRHGVLTILDAHFAPATAQNEHRVIEWLKFEVDLSGRSPQKTPAQTAKSSPIRALDLKPFIESHLGELNPNLADLQTDCGDGQRPLQSLAPVLYGDLDGDGEEEAVVEGWSCLSGNGGADFRGVLKVNSDGKLAVLSIEPMPKTFKGRNPYADLRGHMVIEIKDGRLNEVYGIYNGSEPNCCPEGGERRFIYRWDGHRLTIDDIIDVPAQKSGN
jgi:hypothetical protein